MASSLRPFDCLKDSVFGLELLELNNYWLVFSLSSVLLRAYHCHAPPTPGRATGGDLWGICHQNLSPG